jgi:hypothetical protein
MNYDQEFNDYFRLFELGCYTPEGPCTDWLLYRDSDSAKLLRDRAASLGGRISLSHFIIAFNQLRASGEIRQLRQPAPVEAEDELTVAQYHSLPTAVVQRRFQNDPTFRQNVQKLIDEGKI